MLLGVRARQVDSRTHLDGHVLQRDEGREERRRRCEGRVRVERLLGGPGLGNEASDLLEDGIAADDLSKLYLFTVRTSSSLRIPKDI